MTQYRTFKTTMGHKIRVRMTEQEIKERKILNALIWTTPFVLCWVFAFAAGMV